MGKVDIKTIAKACSVSTATVSRVFNDKEGVSDAVRQQVIEIARKMNYTPKQTTAQHDIAIIIDQNNQLLSGGYSFRAILLSRLLYEFSRHDMSIKIVDISQSDLLLPGYAKTAIPILPEYQAKIVTEKLKSANIPVLFINRVIEGAYAVCTDHYRGTTLALEHLIEAGHKQIGILLDNPENWAGKERIRAYQDTLNKHNLTPLKEQTIHEEQKSIVECLATLHSQGATSLFIGGEGLIEESVYMLSLLKISVPNDMSVISCEKEQVSQWLQPPHTTVSQDLNDICQEVINLVKEIQSGTTVPTTPRFLPSKLIERSSVKYS